MNRGLLATLRDLRCRVAAVVLFALLLPLAAALLPQQALSAEQAFARDLAASVCSDTGIAHAGGQPAAPVHHEACILCAGCAAASSPALAAASEAYAVRMGSASPSHRPATPGLPPLLAALLDATPPRGPPAPALG
jgi:hypothetical protein